MEDKHDVQKNLIKNSITFLHTVSSVFPQNVPALKSFYTTKRRLMESRNNTFLPAIVAKAKERCQKCLISFVDGPATYRVDHGKKKSKFARKMQNKLKNNENLTAFQKKYVKNLKNIDNNQLVVQCKFCNKDNHIPMKKPEKIRTVEIVNNNNNNNKPLKKLKKKKKKKDKFCGLNQEVVNSFKAADNSYMSDTSFISSDVEKPLKKVINLKKSPKETLQTVAAGKVAKQNEKRRKKLQKKSNMQTLTNMLNKDKSIKNNSAANLKNFLQDL